MSSALQDQLKKVGLTDDKQIKKLKGEQRSKRKRGQTGADELEQTRRRVEQTASERTTRDRQLNRQRNLQAERKAITAQIRQLIETHRCSREGGEVGYHFTLGKVIKQLYVPKKMHQEITQGALAIVCLEDAYEVVPIAVAEKIAALDPGQVAVDNSTNQADEDADEYAEHKVPDDLIW